MIIKIAVKIKIVFLLIVLVECSDSTNLATLHGILISDNEIILPLIPLFDANIFEYNIYLDSNTDFIKVAPIFDNDFVKECIISNNHYCPAITL